MEIGRGGESGFLFLECVPPEAPFLSWGVTPPKDDFFLGFWWCFFEGAIADSATQVEESWRRDDGEMTKTVAPVGFERDDEEKGDE